MTISKKNMGYALELEFAAECMKRGGYVSTPVGDNAPYDLIVQANYRLYRVQCKSSSESQEGSSIYHVSTSRPRVVDGNVKFIKLCPLEIDIVVTRAEGDWYFFNNIEELPISLKVYPSAEENERKWNYGRNAWECIDLPRNPQ